MSLLSSPPAFRYFSHHYAPYCISSSSLSCLLLPISPCVECSPFTARVEPAHHEGSQQLIVPPQLLRIVTFSPWASSIAPESRIPDTRSHLPATCWCTQHQHHHAEPLPQEKPVAVDRGMLGRAIPLLEC